MARDTLMPAEPYRYRNAPGPSGYPLVGVLPQMRANPLALLLDTPYRYGDVARLPFGPVQAYLISHPDHARYVLEENHSNFVRDKGIERLRTLLTLFMGDGLSVSEGQFWQRQRSMIQPAFDHGRLPRYFSLIVAEAAAMLDQWEPAARAGRAIDVEAEMMRLVLHTMIRLIFGDSVREEEAEVFAQAVDCSLNYLDDRLLDVVPLPTSLPTPATRRFWSALQTIEAAIYRVIGERRARQEQFDDLLGQLMQARDAQSGEGMSDRQLRDEVMTFFAAGYGPSAFVCTWVWYFLSKNPGVERQLQQELAGALGGRTPTVAALAHLRYTQMVVQEAARLCPPNWGIFRTAVREDEIGGFHIPANANIIINSYYINRHPDFWDEPEHFNPERFSSAFPRPAWAYLAFGGGPHRCVGEHLALLAGPIIVATVAQRYRLLRVLGHDSSPQATSTFLIRPARGLPVTLRKQGGS